MDPELKQKMDETLMVAKDNNRLLRSIRHTQWIGIVGKVVIWIIVLALPLYLYQQYLGPLINKFSFASSTPMTSGPFGFPTSAEIEKLINSFKPGQK